LSGASPFVRLKLTLPLPYCTFRICRVLFHWPGIRTPCVRFLLTQQGAVVLSVSPWRKSVRRYSSIKYASSTQNHPRQQTALVFQIQSVCRMAVGNSRTKQWHRKRQHGQRKPHESGKNWASHRKRRPGCSMYRRTLGFVGSKAYHAQRTSRSGWTSYGIGIAELVHRRAMMPERKE